MADIIVKGKPGRPRKEDGTPEQMAKRAKWREQALARRHKRGDSNSMWGRRVKNKAAKRSFLGPRVCAATGETVDVECHHQRPSAVNRKHHRDILNETASTASVESIHIELKAGDCIWIAKRLNAEINNRTEATMRDFDNATGWSSGRARDSVRDWVCKSITRQVIMREQIKKAMENI